MVQHFKRSGHSSITVNDIYDDDKSRWSRPILLLIVLAIFSGILLYSYNKGKNSASGTVIATIEPDTLYTRIKPEDPAGMEVAHQDMEIYSRVDNSETQEVAIQDNEEAAPESTPEEGAEDTMEKAKSIPYPPARLAKNTSRGSRILSGAEEALKKVAAEKQTPKAEQQVQLDKKVADIVDDRKAVEASLISSNQGRFLLQLASFGSEGAAQDSWNKMKQKNAFLQKLSPRIEKINISGKGQFHRLQAGSWSQKEAASAVCDELKTAGQDCIVVRR